MGRDCYIAKSSTEGEITIREGYSVCPGTHQHISHDTNKKHSSFAMDVIHGFLFIGSRQLPISAILNAMDPGQRHLLTLSLPSDDISLDEYLLQDLGDVGYACVFHYMAFSCYPVCFQSGCIATQVHFISRLEDSFRALPFTTGTLYIFLESLVRGTARFFCLSYVSSLFIFSYFDLVQGSISVPYAGAEVGCRNAVNSGKCFESARWFDLVESGRREPRTEPRTGDLGEDKMWTDFEVDDDNTSTRPTMGSRSNSNTNEQKPSRRTATDFRNSEVTADSLESTPNYKRHLSDRFGITIDPVVPCSSQDND